MTTPITALMLYDLVACPHRVTMDLLADPLQRDEPNAFVQLLWGKGFSYENEDDCRATRVLRDGIDGLIVVHRGAA